MEREKRGEGISFEVFRRQSKLPEPDVAVGTRKDHSAVSLCFRTSHFYKNKEVDVS